MKRTTSTKKKITEKNLDDAVSLFVRNRDKRCVRCGSDKALTCSHFYTRNARSVRWDLENLDTVCWGCHSYWERRKNGEYLDWKKKQLGTTRFLALRKRYYTLRPRPPTEEEKAIMLDNWKL